jgi:glucose dehydrogenase
MRTEPILRLGGIRDPATYTDRNGFFYVLDRVTRKLVVATPFVNENWATGIGSDGRPERLPESGIVCPASGTNGNGTAFSLTTRLYYVMAMEQCDVNLGHAGKRS